MTHEESIQEDDWPTCLCPNCECSFNWGGIETADIPKELVCPECKVTMEIEVIIRTRIVGG